MSTPTTDGLNSRNSTRIYIVVDGERIGRIQSFRHDTQNNVQVMAELGSAYMVEMKKGITRYSFSIAKFLVRSDAIEGLKLGKVFGIQLVDQNLVSDGGSGRSQALESFDACCIDTISRDYTVGQAAIAENATVVTIGKGLTAPVDL